MVEQDAADRLVRKLEFCLRDVVRAIRLGQESNCRLQAELRSLRTDLNLLDRSLSARDKEARKESQRRTALALLTFTDRPLLPEFNRFTPRKSVEEQRADPMSAALVLSASTPRKMPNKLPQLDMKATQKPPKSQQEAVWEEHQEAMYTAVRGIKERKMTAREALSATDELIGELQRVEGKLSQLKSDRAALLSAPAQEVEEAQEEDDEEEEEGEDGELERTQLNPALPPNKVIELARGLEERLLNRIEANRQLVKDIHMASHRSFRTTLAPPSAWNVANDMSSTPRMARTTYEGGFGNFSRGSSVQTTARSRVEP